jgi:hypothetical protein
MSVILATQGAEIRRIMVQSLYLGKKPSQKRAGGMVQGIGPECKLQYGNKKKKRNKVGCGGCGMHWRD